MAIQAKRKTPEARVTEAVIEYLQLRGYLLLTRKWASIVTAANIVQDMPNMPGVFWRANVGAIRPEGRTYPVIFNVPGMPDLMGMAAKGHPRLLAGTAFGIEIKSPKGKQTAVQVEWERMMNGAGAVYVLASCYEDMEASPL